jgi:hypothetical protein
VCLFLHDGQNSKIPPPVLPDESSASRKNISLSERQNLWFNEAIPPGHEGRYGQSSRNVGRGAMDAEACETMRAEADGKGVWS